MNTKSTSKTKLPAMSPEEQELINSGLELIRQQLASVKEFSSSQSQQNAILSGQLPGFTSDLAALTDQAGEANDLFSSISGQYKDILGSELSRFAGGQLATPEELQQIDDAISASRTSGNIEIDRATQDAMEQLREELAPQLGLKSRDTPILDRGGRVAAESVRQKGSLEATLAGTRANSILNLPVTRSQILTNTLGLLENMNLQRSQLAESAFVNRLRLLGQISGSGLNFATGAGATIPALTGTLESGRAASGSVTQSGSFLNLLPTIGQGIGGVGGLLSGASDMGLKF